MITPQTMTDLHLTARSDDPENPEEDEEHEEKSSPFPGFAAQKALFDSRTLLITGNIDDGQAKRAAEQMLAMDAKSDDPITLFISSPGGHVESGDMIYDVARFVNSPVRTIGSGWVASIAALIFVAPPRERRYCLPNTRFLLHEPRGGVGGQASDIAIQARQVIAMRKRLYSIWAEACGQSLEKIEDDAQRDFWLRGQEAIDYGLVGEIITHRSEIDTPASA
jgi:ATP-dependent Clp protease protease subunit